MTITIKQLNESDWQDFRSIRLEALQACPSVYYDNYDNESHKPRDYWLELISLDNGAVFCLYDKDCVIGLTAIFPWKADASGKTAILCMSYLNSDYRGKGLSRYMYQARIDWARDSGAFNKIRVSHREGNEASRRANQAFGFELIGKDMSDWPDGTKDWEYIYELRI